MSTQDETTSKSLPLRLLGRLATLIWWLLLALLVLAALYAGLGRQLTQNINDYRPDIERELSQRLGQHVEIGSLSSRWTWLNPTVVARDLVLKSDAESDEAVGSLQSLRVGLDFLASLSRLRIVFSDFDANGLTLVINQSPRGDIEVEGADLPEPVANDVAQWIDIAGQWLSDPSVRITRIDLGLRDGRGNLRQVEIPQLDLRYRRGLFHASGRAMRPGTTDQLASFELVGQHFFRGDFTGQFYGDINSGRLFDGLAQEYSWQGLRAEGFDLGGQIWLTFRDGLMEQASGTLKTPYLQLGVGSESLAPLEDIQARFGWRRHAANEDHRRADAIDEQTPWYATGEFHLNDLTWQWGGDTVPGFDLRFQSGESAHHLVADNFPIAPVRGLFSSLNVLPDVLVRALEDYRPTGTLNALRLDLPRGDESFRFTSTLSDLSVRAHSGAPAVDGLDGSIVVTRQGGTVQANTEQLTFGFPQLFRGLWPVRNFQADVTWRFDDGATRVFSDNIAMEYGESTGLTGAFDLKMVPGGEDVLGLQVGVERGNAAMLAEFVPMHLVPQDLYDWLTTAITSADSVDGTYYGHGRIGGGTPPGSFVSSMRYGFRNATVNYDERWPAVTGADGEVFIHEGQTRVDLAAGNTGGIELTPGQVRVVPGDGQTMLYIDAGGPVNGDTLSYWMTQSPLGEMSGIPEGSLEVKGSATLDLGLALALGAGQAPTVDATVLTDALSIAYPEANLRWTDIAGELRYTTDAGFSEAPVRARFLGSPVDVRFRRSTSGDGLLIRQSGQTSLAALRDQFELPTAATPGISGRFPYQAQLSLLPNQPARVDLNSSLVGLATNWPAPLGKTAAESAPLAISVLPGQQAGVGLFIDWQDRLNLDLNWQTGRVDVAVNEIWLGDRQWQDVTVEARSGSDSWLISLAAEWIRGMITWPKADGVVTVDLESLALTRSADASEDTDSEPPESEPEAFRNLDAGSWPDVDVSIADLSINGEGAGQWSFGLRPERDRIQVAGIDATLKAMTLTGDLSWGISDESVTTGFTGALNGQSLADIGALFATEIPFRNKKTAIQMDLSWPGRPDQFAMSRVSGNASMRFDEGVILEGNSTAQLFRIFNLLNSDTLWRRLQLDFSDLYEAGVAFDAISGKARLDGGILTLDPELQIVGPSGAFKFSGATNMAAETLDMNMVVVLPLTQNLPLAALLMGAGAPIGGALFVLDKVLGDPLSKLTSATYSVKGTWDNPDVDLRRVFDDGK